ncbi:MAG: hypothetical protein RL662_859 [Bacteroidota bacterium]|jgi:hypothetical protein
MNNHDIERLEKNIQLKKKILGKNIWRNYAIVPPSLILFIGILGILSLYNMDKLFSLYTIPFIILFVLGTIWLKSTKKYLINKVILNNTSIQVCRTIPLITEDKKTVLLFSTNKNRNNKNYLEKEKGEIIKGEINIKNIKKTSTPIDNSESKMILLPRFIQLLKQRYTTSNEYWIAYINNQEIHFLSSKMITKHI